MCANQVRGTCQVCTAPVVEKRRPTILCHDGFCVFAKGIVSWTFLPRLCTIIKKSAFNNKLCTLWCVCYANITSLTCSPASLPHSEFPTGSNVFVVYQRQLFFGESPHLSCLYLFFPLPVNAWELPKEEPATDNHDNYCRVLHTPAIQSIQQTINIIV